MPRGSGGRPPSCSCLLLSVTRPAGFLTHPPPLPLRQLLVKEREQRLTLDRVLQHEWIVANADPAVLARQGKQPSAA